MNIINIEKGTINDDFFYNRFVLKITFENDTYCFVRLYEETGEIKKIINSNYDEIEISKAFKCKIIEGLEIIDKSKKVKS